jgi:HEAT repeat protein
MRLCLIALALIAPLGAQEVRPKDVREAAKAGSSALPKLQEFLKNPDVEVRVEAVKQITEIGTARSLDPLILATQDNDPEVQIHATDGLVNFIYRTSRPDSRHLSARAPVLKGNSPIPTTR